MKKICKHCGKEIKGKAKNYDYYYFCNNIDCLDKYLNEPEKKYTIVLAGNYDQFLYFLDEIGATDSDYIYGDIQNIRGIVARDVVEYGTFWDRKDAGKLKDLANSRIR